ncbi:hypothetical protein GCM10011313_28090 [Mycetocola zhadangensis]|nr:hypothetical protein GCM10011313_28090 [Mycetocola zhadangensis]
MFTTPVSPGGPGVLRIAHELGKDCQKEQDHLRTSETDEHVAVSRAGPFIAMTSKGGIRVTSATPTATAAANTPMPVAMPSIALQSRSTTIREANGKDVRHMTGT